MYAKKTCNQSDGILNGPCHVEHDPVPAFPSALCDHVKDGFTTQRILPRVRSAFLSTCSSAPLSFPESPLEQPPSGTWALEVRHSHLLSSSLIKCRRQAPRLRRCLSLGLHPPGAFAGDANFFLTCIFLSFFTPYARLNTHRFGSSYATKLKYIHIPSTSAGISRHIALID